MSLVPHYSSHFILAVWEMGTVHIALLINQVRLFYSIKIWLKKSRDCIYYNYLCLHRAYEKERLYLL